MSGIRAAGSAPDLATSDAGAVTADQVTGAETRSLITPGRTGDSSTLDPAGPPGSPDAADQLVGTTILGRYKVESLLGSGGMGAVYLVQHIHMRKRYALKVLHAETSQVPELVARFEREAVASAHADHPNIALATDFGRSESGAFYLILEYLEGQRLRDTLAQGPLELRRAVHIARQVLCALERSHELGIIHRDLKPENIMLVWRQGDRDFVKVLDFGLATVRRSAPVEESRRLRSRGTPAGGAAAQGRRAVSRSWRQGLRAWGCGPSC